MSSSTFYASPSYMNGGAFTVYSGSRRQKGGGFLGSLRSIMAPVGRNLVKGVQNIARNKTVQDLAKTVARKGTEALANVAVDALQGRNIREAFSDRSKRAALEALTGDVTSHPPQKKRRVSIKKQVKNNPYIASGNGFKQKKRLQVVKQKFRRGKKRLSRAELNRKDLF